MKEYKGCQALYDMNVYRFYKPEGEKDKIKKLCKVVVGERVNGIL